MKKVDAKFYCIVEIQKNSTGMTRKIEVFSSNDLETVEGIKQVCDFSMEMYGATSAIIIFIQKLKP